MQPGLLNWQVLRMGISLVQIYKFLKLESVPAAEMDSFVARTQNPIILNQGCSILM